VALATATRYGTFGRLCLHGWWVEPTTGVAAYYALGFGGQLVEVVPTLHLVIVVPAYVDDACPDAPAAGADELQHLVDTIVLIIKTYPTR
jgi:CubicO group peptidase (beta-lactamase class C family)